MELTYTADEQGILYPNLIAPTEVAAEIGIWGRMRQRYLKEHRRALYTLLKVEGRLRTHLAEIDRSATAMFDDLVEKMAKSHDIDEVLKQRDQMAWVRAMNNIHNSAKEVICAELIYI